MPGLGFPISTRGGQSWLDREHPSRLGPWKRPRLTPNPAMALKDGRVAVAFGCPGGDFQVQGMLQVFLNLVEFGLDPQSAIEAPRVVTRSFQNSFWPHVYEPGRVDAETRIPEAVRARPRRPGARGARQPPLGRRLARLRRHRGRRRRARRGRRPPRRLLRGGVVAGDGRSRRRRGGRSRAGDVARAGRREAAARIGLDAREAGCCHGPGTRPSPGSTRGLAAAPGPGLAGVDEGPRGPLARPQRAAPRKHTTRRSAPQQVDPAQDRPSQAATHRSGCTS